MSNDPFAHSRPPEFLPDEATLPPRTSIMAILSLVLSLICCIPGLGAIGAILGGVSLVSISRSQGRLSGAGLAIAGIIIGLLVSLVWIGTFTLTSAGFNIMAEGVDDALAAVETDDANALGMAMPGVTVSDAEIDAFRDAYQAEYGAYSGLPSGLWGQIQGWLAQGATTQTALNQARGVYAPPNYQVIPLVARFDQAEALVMLIVPAGSQDPENIGVVARDGSFIWLKDPTGGTSAPAGP